jgi:hypothetical protein
LIGGSVQGDVTGTEAVLIAETGRVVGDLSAPRIGMSEGAMVRGSVRTDGNAGAPASPRGSAQRERAAEPRPAAAPAERSGSSERIASSERNVPERSAPRAQPVHQASAQRPASSGAGAQMAASTKPAFKKQPPPPVITAPRPGARARKKLSRR